MILKQKTLNACTGQEISTDNVKCSNFYYEKIIMQKACHCAFSIMVLSLQIKASYMRFRIEKIPGVPVEEFTPE